MADGKVETTINTDKLDTILKVLKENKYTIKVGILGDKNSRSDNGGSNATIGAAHEFGTDKIPKRSFLRMPLEMQFGKDLQNINLLDEKGIGTFIKDKSLKSLADKVGVLAVATILKAFDSGGFGTWQTLSETTLRERALKNTGSQILVETHQLRDSITYEVKKNK